MEHSTMHETMMTNDSVAANDSNTSGVAWGAVMGGAFVTAALSLTLLALGTGIGLSAASPWANSGASASAIGWTAIAWLVLMEIIASSIGGYLAGRLRVKWVSIHTHEVYFRDTAHGFLVWAVGLVIMAGFLASSAASMVASRNRAQVSETDAATSRTAGALSPSAYFVDMLLRTSPSSATQADASVRSETSRIFAYGIAEGNLPQADRAYLSHVVAAIAAINEAEAEQRVDDVFARAQIAADQARKVVAHSMYWTFLALLVGAFSASVAATVGGKQRDRVVVI